MCWYWIWIHETSLKIWFQKHHLHLRHPCQRREKQRHRSTVDHVKVGIQCLMPFSIALVTFNFAVLGRKYPSYINAVPERKPKLPLGVLVGKPRGLQSQSSMEYDDLSQDSCSTTDSLLLTPNTPDPKLDLPDFKKTLSVLPGIVIEKSLNNFHSLLVS